MRLTSELIANSPQFTNCLRLREIDLRAQKIPAIESLGATLDQFDVIDLTDNEIRKLDNFPLLRRLRILLLSNNRISKISDSLGQQLPNLETINLANNYVLDLSEIDALSGLKNLKNLNLLENNVSKQPRYRLYVIHCLPNLKTLDFKKVTDAERKEAIKTFGSEKKASHPLAKKTFSTASGMEIDEENRVGDEGGGAAGGEGEEGGKKKPLTAEQIVALKAAIANAKTLQEISFLEQQLRQGSLPTLAG